MLSPVPTPRRRAFLVPGSEFLVRKARPCRLATRAPAGLRPTWTSPRRWRSLPQLLPPPDPLSRVCTTGCTPVRCVGTSRRRRPAGAQRGRRRGGLRFAGLQHGSRAGAGRGFTSEVRQREVQQRTGIPAGNVLLAATHAHSHPQTTDITARWGTVPGRRPLARGFPGQWRRRAPAWSAGTPAALRGATGLCPASPGAGASSPATGGWFASPAPAGRPGGEGARDDRVPLLLAPSATTARTCRRGGGGGAEGTDGFHLPPTTVQVQPLVSADYPGGGLRLVERELGAEACLFLQGPAATSAPCGPPPICRTSSSTAGPSGGGAARPLAAGSARPAGDPAGAGRRGVRWCEWTAAPAERRRRWPRQSALLASADRRAPAAAARRAAMAAYRRGGRVPAPGAGLGDRPGGHRSAGSPAGRRPDRGLRGRAARRIRRPDQRRVAWRRDFVAAYANGYEGYIPTRRPGTRGLRVSVGPWTRVWRDAGGRGRRRRPRRPRPAGLGRGRPRRGEARPGEHGERNRT